MEKGKDEDDLIRHMAERMMIKFDKYWDEYSEVLAFGVILDPIVKLETLGYCLEHIDPLSWEAKLDTIKEKLYRLFSQFLQILQVQLKQDVVISQQLLLPPNVHILM